jgi:hypothetical protein
MSLASLYRGHAAVCTRMAAVARSLEIKEQWTSLAAKWVQKAEADEHLQASAQPQSIRSPTLVPTEPKPTAAPERPQPIPVPRAESAPTETRPTKLNVGSIEEVWTKIANVSLD